MFFRFILCIALAAAFFSCGSGSTDITAGDTLTDSTAFICKKIDCEKKRFRLDTFFRNREKESGLNGAVLIAQQGVVIYRNAFGIADKRSKDSLTTHSSFQLASVSKQFTAAAIMLLHQQGKLNYSDSIQKFFPGFPYHGITVRQLLTHRSGLANYIYFIDDYYRALDTFPEKLSNRDVVDFMMIHQPAVYRQPGVKFEYSNTGYALLAAITEKVSGQPFWQFMRDHFFRPLQMNDTWVSGDTAKHAHTTKAYYGAWKEWSGNYLDGVTGDKGVYASVDDLFRWDEALYAGTILQKKTLDEAFTNASPEKRGSGYGYGWRIRDWADGNKSVFHNGWWHGYNTVFFRGLHDKTTIIILCNKYNRGIYQVQPLLQLLGTENLSWENEDENENATVKDP